LRLEAENVVPRHQLMVLRRRLRGRVRITSSPNQGSVLGGLGKAGSTIPDNPIGTLQPHPELQTVSRLAQTFPDLLCQGRLDGAGLADV
jgi:hypothetical protein